jgi:hypothetical protein
MRLLVIADTGSLDYQDFKKEVDTYSDIYELLYFAAATGKAPELCEKYAAEEMEFYATRIWNGPSEENIMGYTLFALQTSLTKIDHVLWFTNDSEYSRGGTVGQTFYQWDKPIKFAKMSKPAGFPTWKHINYSQR